MPVRHHRAALRRLHVEGYPRLDVQVAHRAVTDGRPNVLWRDQAGMVWGRARVSIDAGHLEISAQFRAVMGGPARESTDVLVLETVLNDQSAKHYFTSCPSCHKRVRVLAWADGRWSCQQCQRLAHRSMMIGAVARRTEKLAQLKERIGGGRPRGMHEATFLRLLADYRLLKAELQEETATASAEYEEVVTALWLGEPPALPGAVDDEGSGGIGGGGGRDGRDGGGG